MNLSINLLFKYQNPAVIYYHMVTDNTDCFYPEVKGISDFRKELKYLKNHFTIVPLKEAVERSQNNKLDQNSLVITIDDGFAECHSIIAPILSEEKIPATFFLIENTIDNQNIMWQYQLQYLQTALSKKEKFAAVNSFYNQNGINGKPTANLLQLSKSWQNKDKIRYAQMLWDLSMRISIKEWMEENQPYLTTEQIHDLISAGFEIGSHSSNHFSCDTLKYDALENEIVGSCQKIGEKFQKEIQFFSYPFGRRAKRKYELKMLQNSNLRCLIGGKPRLFRKNQIPFWEAYNFERNKSTLLYHLFVNSFLL